MPELDLDELERLAAQATPGPGRRRMKYKRLYWVYLVNRIKCALVIWNHHTMTPLERRLHKARLI